MFDGTTHQVSFDSEPQGATVEFDGIPKGETPIVLSVDRDFKGNIQYKAEGYETKTFQIPTSFNSTSLLNLLGLGSGFIVDIVTGAIHEFDQTEFNLELEKEENN